MFRPVSGGVLRIVIADDHAPTRRSLRDQLEGAGFDVCGEAARGADALQVALRERPDVCLLDVLMPGGNGVNAAREIKRALPETKVVLLTAVPDEEGAVAAARAGADGYLGKDTDSSRLSEVVRAIVAGEAAYPRRLLPYVLAALVDAPTIR